MKWDGFRPVMYSLAEKVLSLPLSTDHSPKEQPNTTIADLLRGFDGKNFSLEDQLTSFTLKTDSGALEVRGVSFNLKMAATLLELQREGIKAFATRWFWYGKDTSTTDPTDSYNFFVVGDDRIVRDEIRFLDYAGSGFDPAIFGSFEEGDDGDEWFAAWAAFWYRRFYQETRIGQLTVLRPDKPELHYYPEGRALNSRDELSESLKQIRTGLWIAVALLALIAYRILVK